MKHLLLDANVLVRFFVQDDAKQGPAATALLEAAERGEYRLHLDSLTLAETVYVLTGRYHRNRDDVVTALLAVIQNAGVETAEAGIVADALRRYADTKVDFADAWLAARAARFGFGVASFDRDLDKFKDIRRLEPKAS
jgi:predicted nucleic-acid-binding protein